jgi:hypothetical protein
MPIPILGSYQPLTNFIIQIAFAVPAAMQGVILTSACQLSGRKKSRPNIGRPKEIHPS